MPGPDPKALGRLERVELRNIWLSESSDFTPWLARAENLSLLGDALGIDLQLEAQEKRVGPFRADILCKDIGSNAWVLIENQLEKTIKQHSFHNFVTSSSLRVTCSSIWTGRSEWSYGLTRLELTIYARVRCEAERFRDELTFITYRAVFS